MSKESDENPEIEEPKVLTKEVNVQHTGRQFLIQIPVQVAELLDIEKGDKFVFNVPLNSPEKYSFKLKQKTKNKNGK